MVSVSTVHSKKELKLFVRFPEFLYKNNPLWVPPLRWDEMNALNKKKAPAFRHCEAEYFLAYKDGRIVGRVAAIINTIANKEWCSNTVRFGWIEFEDDTEISTALIKAVINWGKERGMDTIKGPLGFSDMDKEGLLVEGFENLPSITCLYNPPYYIDHLERLGFVKDVDWTQRIVDIPDSLPDKIVSFDKIVRERYGYKVMYPKRNSEFRKRGIEILQVMNKSFQVLYEYSLLNDEQIKDYVNQYLPFVDKDIVCIVMDKEDNIVGFAITIPSLSKAFQKAKGKLFPFGFLHILRALKKNDLVEALMIGIAPEHQGKGINAIMFHHIFKGCQKYGFKRLVLNPQLESNTRVTTLFDEYNPKLYMRRRCYTADLSTAEKIIEQTLSTSSSVI